MIVERWAYRWLSKTAAGNWLRPILSVENVLSRNYVAGCFEVVGDTREEWLKAALPLVFATDG